MGLKYKIMRSLKQTGTGEKKPFWYPQLTGSQKMNLEEVAEILASRTTASRADVHLVVTGLTELIPELLLRGNTVHLGKLGSFRLRAKATPVEEPHKVTSRHIRELRAAFIPAPAMKKKLKDARFEKVKEG